MSGRRVARMCGVAVLWLAGTAVLAHPPPDTYAEQDFSRVDKIDTHVHLYGELPVFLARAKADAFRVLTINVNYADFPPLPEQLASAIALRRANPGRVAFAATFDAQGSDRPEWLDRKSTRLNSSHIEPSRMPSSA